MRTTETDILADLDPGLISIFSQQTRADSDADGVVDGADYVVWRDTLGDGTSNTVLVTERQARGGDHVGVGIDPKFMGDGDPFPLEGDDGNNVLHGTDGHDIIYGHGGHDNIYGEGGPDHLYGGDGHDWISGGTGNDYLAGGAGNDALWGDTAYAESGQDGDDVLSGGAGDDIMWGQGGDDLLIGGAGNNTYYGGSGDDLLVGSHAGDEMWGNAGADRFADIGAGNSNIQVRDYDFALDGDLVDGVSYAYDAASGNTLVYDGDGYLKFTLWNYNADADGIGFFDYALEPAG